MLVTLQELQDNFDWEKVCKVLELEVWCLNEGADGDFYVHITEDQARKIGLIPEER